MRTGRQSDISQAAAYYTSVSPGQTPSNITIGGDAGVRMRYPSHSTTPGLARCLPSSGRTRPTEKLDEVDVVVARLELPEADDDNVVDVEEVLRERDETLEVLVESDASLSEEDGVRGVLDGVKLTLDDVDLLRRVTAVAYDPRCKVPTDTGKLSRPAVSRAGRSWSS